MPLARRIGAATLAVSALAGTLTLAPAPAASAAEQCSTASKTYYLSEAKVPTRLGHVRMRVQVCTQNGMITDSRAWGEDSTTAPAKLGGWEIKLNIPYQSRKGKTVTQWSATGKAQTCLAGKVPVCSYAENFRITGRYYARNYIGPKPGYKRMHWKPQCTNKYCKLHFNETM